MKKQIKVLGLVGLVVVVLVAGTMLFRARKVEVEPEAPIRIGAILPLTGHLSWFGEHGRNAALLLEEELNAQEKQVEIRIYDSKSLPKHGLSAYRKMVMENIRYAYVSLDPVSKSILPNIERDKVIMFAGSVDNDIAKESKNIFRCYFGFRDQSLAQYDFLRAIGAESVSMMGIDIALVRKYMEEWLGDMLKEAGITLKGIHLFDRDTRDFRDILTKIKFEAPDAVVISEYGALYPIIYSQLIELGLKDTFKIVDGLGMLNVRKEDHHLYEGVVFVAPAYFGKDRDFKRRYIEKFGILPTYEAYYAYDSLKSLFLAVKNSDGSVEGVRNFLLNNELPGVSQPILRFDEHGDLEVATVLKTFRDGEIVFYE